MRTLTLVGKVYRNTKIARLAIRCAWCRRFASHDDERAAMEGAKVSHGCCASCQRKLLASLDSIPPKPAA